MFDDLIKKKLHMCFEYYGSKDREFQFGEKF